MTIAVGYGKDIGRRRPQNQDEVLVAQPLRLFAVADGVGKYQGGEVASRLAVESLAEYLYGEKLEDSPANKTALIGKAIHYAHQRICSQREVQPELWEMGTTLALAWAWEKDVVIGHVGDSRVYHLIEGRLTQITRDHSRVQDLIQWGVITQEEGRRHKQRNIITRALGREPFAGPEIQVRSWSPGDVMLLCTDGLTTMVEDDTIARIIGQLHFNLQQCAEELIRMANEQGGRDNIAVVLIRYD